MAFLSQALHLGSLLLPHNAFQEHAAHLAEWSAKLAPRAQSVPAYAQVLRHSSIALARRTRITWWRCHCSSKASRGEDLQVEDPVACRYSPAFHFHPTLPGMLGATLIGNQVVQVRQPGEKRLLTPPGMMEAFHREQFPVDGVMGLIQQGARHRHLRVCEHRIPARFLVLKPAPHALAIGRSRRRGDVVGKAA